MLTCAVQYARQHDAWLKSFDSFGRGTTTASKLVGATGTAADPVVMLRSAGMQSAALGFMLAQAHFADALVAVPSAVSVVFMVGSTLQALLLSAVEAVAISLVVCFWVLQ